MLFDEMMKIAAADRREIRKFSEDIWAHPELGFEETHACAAQVKLLQEKGYRITTPFAGLETAFQAEIGTGGEVFAIASEYDALPGIGHGCGHNLICGAAMTAATILAEYLKRHEIPGRIRIIGTPGEEGKGGKVVMAKKNCLAGVGAVMMVHPSIENRMDSGSLAVHHLTVEFFGKSTHASVAPEAGINALDALIMLFNSMACWRQQLPESSRLHGVIEVGGTVPNVIPDYTRGSFYLRAEDDDYLNIMEKRFEKMVNAACEMTGCTSKTTAMGCSYKARVPNTPMNNLYKTIMEDLGQPVKAQENKGRGSSDFGDFSAVCPGIHPYFALADENLPVHSREFAAAANTDPAYENMEKAGITMAHIAWQFLTDQQFRDEVRGCFLKQEKNGL